MTCLMKSGSASLSGRVMKASFSHQSFRSCGYDHKEGSLCGGLDKPPMPYGRQGDLLLYTESQLANASQREQLVRALHGHHQRASGDRQMLYVSSLEVNGLNETSPCDTVCLLQPLVPEGSHGCLKIGLLIGNLTVKKFSLFRGANYGSIHFTVSPHVQLFLQHLGKKFKITYPSDLQGIKVRCELDSTGYPAWRTYEVFVHPTSASSSSSSSSSSDSEGLEPHQVPHDYPHCVPLSSSCAKDSMWPSSSLEPRDAPRCGVEYLDHEGFEEAIVVSDASRRGRKKRFVHKKRTNSPSVDSPDLSGSSLHVLPKEGCPPDHTASRDPATKPLMYSTYSCIRKHRILDHVKRCHSTEEDIFVDLRRRCIPGHTQVEAIIHLGHVCPYQKSNFLILFLRELRLVISTPLDAGLDSKFLDTSPPTFPPPNHSVGCGPFPACESDPKLVFHPSLSVAAPSPAPRHRSCVEGAVLTSASCALSSPSSQEMGPKRPLMQLCDAGVEGRHLSSSNSSFSGVCVNSVTVSHEDTPEVTLSSECFGCSGPPVTSPCNGRQDDEAVALQCGEEVKEKKAVERGGAGDLFSEERLFSVPHSMSTREWLEASRCPRVEWNGLRGSLDAVEEKSSVHGRVAAGGATESQERRAVERVVFPCLVTDVLHPRNVKMQRMLKSLVAREAASVFRVGSHRVKEPCGGGRQHKASGDALESDLERKPSGMSMTSWSLSEEELEGSCMGSRVEDPGGYSKDSEKRLGHGKPRGCENGSMFSVGDFVQIGKVEGRRDILENQTAEIIRISDTAARDGTLHVTVSLRRVDGSRFQGQHNPIREDIPATSLKLVDPPRRRQVGGKEAVPPSTAGGGVLPKKGTQRTAKSLKRSVHEGGSVQERGDPPSTLADMTDLGPNSFDPGFSANPLGDRGLVSEPFTLCPPRTSEGVLCFFWDLEATGLRVNVDDITQIACICRRFFFSPKPNTTTQEISGDVHEFYSSSHLTGYWETVHGYPEKEFNCYVYTDRVIPEPVVQLTGITNEFLDKYGVSFQKAVHNWASWILSAKQKHKNCPVWFVAHNGNRFDLPLLFQQEICKLGQPPGAFLSSVGTVGIVDTVVLSRRLPWGDLGTTRRSHKLHTLYSDVFHRNMPNEHDALGDVVGLAALMNQDPFLFAWSNVSVGWTLSEYLLWSCYNHLPCVVDVAFTDPPRAPQYLPPKTNRCHAKMLERAEHFFSPLSPHPPGGSNELSRVSQDPLAAQDLCGAFPLSTYSPHGVLDASGFTSFMFPPTTPPHRETLDKKPTSMGWLSGSAGEKRNRKTGDTTGHPTALPTIASTQKVLSLHRPEDTSPGSVRGVYPMDVALGFPLPSTVALPVAATTQVFSQPLLPSHIYLGPHHPCQGFHPHVPFSDYSSLLSWPRYTVDASNGSRSSVLPFHTDAPRTWVKHKDTSLLSHSIRETWPLLSPTSSSKAYGPEPSFDIVQKSSGSCGVVGVKKKSTALPLTTPLPSHEVLSTKRTDTTHFAYTMGGDRIESPWESLVQGSPQKDPQPTQHSGHPSDHQPSSTLPSSTLSSSTVPAPHNSSVGVPVANDPRRPWTTRVKHPSPPLWMDTSLGYPSTVKLTEDVPSSKPDPASKLLNDLSTSRYMAKVYPGVRRTPAQLGSKACGSSITWPKQPVASGGGLKVQKTHTLTPWMPRFKGKVRCPATPGLLNPKSVEKAPHHTSLWSLRTHHNTRWTLDRPMPQDPRKLTHKPQDSTQFNAPWSLGLSRPKLYKETHPKLVHLTLDPTPRKQGSPDHSALSPRPSPQSSLVSSELWTRNRVTAKEGGASSLHKKKPRGGRGPTPSHWTASHSCGGSPPLQDSTYLPEPISSPDAPPSLHQSQGPLCSPEKKKTLKSTSRGTHAPQPHGATPQASYGGASKPSLSMHSLFNTPRTPEASSYPAGTPLSWHSRYRAVMTSPLTTQSLPYSKAHMHSSLLTRHTSGSAPKSVPMKSMKILKRGTPEGAPPSFLKSPPAGVNATPQPPESKASSPLLVASRPSTWPKSYATLPAF